MRLALIIFSLFALSSFKDVPEDPFKEMAQVREGLFMDRVEVANYHYRQYVHWLEKNGPTANYEAALPNENIYPADQEVLKDYYFKHQAYNYYPVVGVSYEQALAYCNWRSDRVNEMIGIRKLNKKGKRFYGKKVIYRLPTKAEWEFMASDALSEKERNRNYEKVSESHSGKEYPTSRYYLATLQPTGEIVKQKVPSPVRSLEPITGNNLYHLIGNVAEMVQEKGISKGGSYEHILEETSIEKDFTYTEPQIWLGFRCVMEVLEN